ncbi:MAG: hypothetical protein KKG70_13185 [Proteobacteria bacterium]|nr:hypothetical protein [Pseudomonadota bacterium]
MERKQSNGRKVSIKMDILPKNTQTSQGKIEVFWCGLAKFGCVHCKERGKGETNIFYSKSGVGRLESIPIGQGWIFCAKTKKENLYAATCCGNPGSELGPGMYAAAVVGWRGLN